MSAKLDSKGLEALLDRYSKGVWDWNGKPIPSYVVRQQFQEFANEVATLTTSGLTDRLSAAEAAWMAGNAQITKYVAERDALAADNAVLRSGAEVLLSEIDTACSMDDVIAASATLRAALSNQSTASLKAPDVGKMVDDLLAKDEANLVLYRDEHCQGDSAIKQFHHTFAEGRIAEVKSLRSKLSAILAHASQPAEGQGERGEADYWAVHSQTGMHIGLWSNRADADEALRQYDGGKLTPLYATPPAPHPLEGAVKVKALERVQERIELWFFRDMSSEQRLKLFSLFGLPVDEIGDTHGHQRIVLRRLLSALSAPTGDGWRP